jgi:WD40 repeat protein
LFRAAGSHAAFAEGGKLLVTADGYGTPALLRVHDAKGQPLRQWPTSQTHNKDNAFAQGAEHMAVAAGAPLIALLDRAAPSVVQLRDLTTGATVRSIDTGPQSRQWLTLTTDGKTLATASDKGVRLWDTATGKEVRSWGQRADSPAVFTADGLRLAWTGYGPGIARLWAVGRDDAAPRAVGAPVNNFEAPGFSPDGTVLAVVTDGHAVQLRRFADGKDVLPLDAHDGPVYRLAFTPDGRHVVSGARTGLCTWEALTGRLVRRQALGAGPDESLVALLPDGRLLTAERTADPRNGVFRLRDPLTGREALRAAGRPDAGEITVAPGGRYVGLGGPRDGAFSILDLRTGGWRYRGDPREAHFHPKLSADGEVLVWSSRVPWPGEIHVRRQATGKTLVVHGLPKGDDADRWLRQFDCVSPDGRWFLLPGGDGRVRRWDLLTGKEAAPLAGAQRTVWGLFWSPDSRVVVARGSASPANVIDREARRDLRAWDTTTGKRLPHLDLEGYPQSVRFTPDAYTLLTDNRDEIRLREVATGQDRCRLRGHLPCWISALVVSEDGKLLASGGDDAQVLVWDLTGRMPDGRWRTERQAPGQLAAAWEALAGADGRAASAALWQLAADPEGTVALLRQRLRPVYAADGAKLAELVGELSSERFTVRERADKELARLGEVAEPVLRKALEGQPAEELRRRLLKLVELLEAVPAGEGLRALRAVEVLERIGTAEARQVLEGLAGGASARLTRQARAALARLERRQRD